MNDNDPGGLRKTVVAGCFAVASAATLGGLLGGLLGTALKPGMDGLAKLGQATAAAQPAFTKAALAFADSQPAIAEAAQGVQSLGRSSAALTEVATKAAAKSWWRHLLCRPPPKPAPSKRKDGSKDGSKDLPPTPPAPVCVCGREPAGASSS